MKLIFTFALVFLTAGVASAGQNFLNETVDRLSLKVFDCVNHRRNCFKDDSRAIAYEAMMNVLLHKMAKSTDEAEIDRFYNAIQKLNGRTYPILSSQKVQPVDGVRQFEREQLLSDEERFSNVISCAYFVLNCLHAEDGKIDYSEMNKIVLGELGSRTDENEIEQLVQISLRLQVLLLREQFP